MLSYLMLFGNFSFVSDALKYLSGLAVVKTENLFQQFLALPVLAG